jgi:hypothetical protein
VSNYPADTEVPSFARKVVCAVARVVAISTCGPAREFFRPLKDPTGASMRKGQARGVTKVGA